MPGQGTTLVGEPGPSDPGGTPGAAGKGTSVHQPLLPDYGGACVTNVVPALLEPSAEDPVWMPPGVTGADQIVLLVLDGLGWHQLRARPEHAPHLSAMAG